MDESLRAAVLGAGTAPMPASPLGASLAPELAGLNAASFAVPVSNSSAGGLVVQAQEANDRAARAAAATKQKQADLTNPKSYRKVKKKDGGFDFYDPDGNQVDIATITQRTGAKAREFIKDSENPIDIQYMEESDNLQDYITAKLSGNKKKYQEYEQANPELKRYQGKGGVDKLISKFKQRYERYYVPRSENPNAWGTRPSDNPLVPYRMSVEEDEEDSGL